MNDLLNIFKILSDKNRLRILMMLYEQELCVCEIQEIIQVTISTVSKHLSILKSAGFIEERKKGKWVYYRIAKNFNNMPLKEILFILPSWLEGNEEIMNDLEKVKKIKEVLTCSTN
ncbi:MAG: ArsR/SmtB family transcription factor [Candidatus Kapaibacteriota bacterium]